MEPTPLAQEGYGMTFQLHGDEMITLDDMGGTIVLSQHSELSGRMESVVLELGQLWQAVEIARHRYGSEGTKNTDRAMASAVLEI